MKLIYKLFNKRNLKNTPIDNCLQIMPVKLRLRRQGRKKAPHYAIVAADSRAPRDGRYIEKIGHYNPTTTPAQVFVDQVVSR